MINKPVFLTINKMYYPEIGGVETVAKEIAELASKNGYDSKVLTFSHDNNFVEDMINNVHVIRSKTFFKKGSIRLSIDFIKKYKKLSEKANVEIFHFPSGFPEVFYQKKRKGVKRIVFYHADIVGRGLVGKVYNLTFVKSLLDSADIIIGTSPKMFQTSRVLKLYKKNRKIVPLFVDIDFFKPNGNRYDLSSFGIEVKNRKIVLYTGRFGRYKGLKYLIKSLKLLSEEYMLLLVGNGPSKSNLEELVDKLKLKGRVFFLSHVPYADLPSIYRIADVFVLPSIDRGEAFGLVALEAMACGIPIITTELGTGTTYYNLDNITGLHISPRNKCELSKAIKKICENNWKSLRKNEILSQASNFSLEIFQKRIIKLFLNSDK